MEEEKRLNEQAPTLTGGSFRFEMPVRWGDLDALNHVNNTVYFRYMEEARVHCARVSSIGGPDTGRDIVLAHVSCDFLRPVLWPATVLIDMRLGRVGRSSVEFEVEMSVKGTDDGPCARARSTIVGIDSATGRSSPWTQDELDGMARTFAVGA